jgi:hypothetical protein
VSTPIDYVKAATVDPVSGLSFYNPLALGVGKVVGQSVGATGVIQSTYAATQAPPIVGEAAYNVAFPNGYTDQYGNMFLASQNEPVFFVTNPGALTLTGIAVTGQTTATGAASGVGLGVGSTGNNPGAGSGTGYVTAPAVQITPPSCTMPGTQNNPCTQATAVANVANGQVMSVTLTNPGAGYTAVPSVTFVSGSTLASASLTAVGSGYSAATPPVVTVTGGGGTGAVVTATVNAAGAVSALTVTNAGTGYTSTPTISIAPPPVLAATGTATVAGGAVTGVTVAKAGTYAANTSPTVTFSAPPLAVQGTPASATAQLLAQYCCTFLVNNGGSGYGTTPPVVTVTGTTTGTPAAAVATLTNGVVTAVTLDPTALGGGLGTSYTGPVSVSIAAPPVVAANVAASGTAVMDAVTGTTVASVTITNPGSGYTTAPTVTFSGGTPAAGVAAFAAGGYGATATAIASTTQAFVVPSAIPGAGVPATANAVPLTLPSTLATMMGCNSTQTTCSNTSSVVMGRLMNPAIQELFEPFYGRMNATLGIEMPNQSLTVQTTLPLNYIDPATEVIEPGTAQMWKITHNGVDAHPVHIHLVNAQIVNRVGWDGTVKAPEDNEIGWKETIKMNPLEDIIVVMKAAMPQVPFGIDRSIRAQDPSQPLGVNMGFTQVDVVGINGNAPNGLPVPAGALGIGEPATVVNSIEDYDNEYVWHCHILGHEENDFMRAFVATSQTTAPDAPTNFVVTQAAAGQPVVATWVDPTPIASPTTYGNPKNELGFNLERSLDGGVTWVLIANLPANGTTATDTLINPVKAGTTAMYRVYGYNAPTAGRLIGGTNNGVGTPAVASIVVQ